MNGPARTRSMLTDSVMVYATRMIVSSLSLLGVVLLARGLGAEGRGLLAAMLVYPQLLIALFEGGMRQAATYHIGRKTFAESDVAGSLLAFFVLAGTVGTAACYFVLRTEFEDLSRSLALSAAMLVPLSLAVAYLRGLFLGKEQISSFNATAWLPKVVYVGTIAALLAAGLLSITGAVIATLIAYGLNSAQAVWLWWSRVRRGVTFNWMVFRNMVRLGSVYGLALFFIVANYRIDIVLLTWLDTPDEVGRYVVAAQIGELLWQLPAAIGMILFSRSANDRHREQWTASATRAVRLTLAVCGFAAVALALSSVVLIPWIFGMEYLGTDRILVLLLPGLVAMVIFKMLNMDLAGEAKPFVSLVIMIPATVMNIVLNMLLIPDLGGQGAALASTVSYCGASAAMAFAYAAMKERPVAEILWPSRDDWKDLIRAGRRQLRMRFGWVR